MTPDYYWLPVFEDGKQLQIADISEHCGHAVGSAIDYGWRAGKKPGASVESDLQKARDWLERKRVPAHEKKAYGMALGLHRASNYDRRANTVLGLVMYAFCDFEKNQCIEDIDALERELTGAAQ